MTKVNLEIEHFMRQSGKVRSRQTSQGACVMSHGLVVMAMGLERMRWERQAKGRMERSLDLMIQVYEKATMIPRA